MHRYDRDRPAVDQQAGQKHDEPPASVVNTILGSFSHMEDTQLYEEEVVAKNVAAIAYAGMCKSCVPVTCTEKCSPLGMCRRGRHGEYVNPRV